MEKKSSPVAMFSFWQQASLITSTLIGVGILTLPRTSTQMLHQEGWIASLLGGLFAMVAICLIAKLSSYYPGLTFIQFSPLVWGTRKKNDLVGKIISFLFVAIYLGYLFVITAMISRIFGGVVVTAVLRDTPIEAIIIIMFVLAFFLCLHRPEVVARVNELLLILIVVPVILISIASFQRGDWNNLFPLFSENWKTVMQGAFSTSFSYQGFEIMLIFYAFAKAGTDKTKAGVVGISLAMFVYTLIIVAGIVVFGFEELQRLSWPTLEIVKTTQFPGLILERLESAFLAVWVTAVFTTVANLYYSFVFGLKQLFGKTIIFQRIMAFIMLFPLFYISLLPRSILAVFELMNMIGYLGLFVTIGVPIIYLLISIVRTARQRKE